MKKTLWTALAAALLATLAVASAPAAFKYKGDFLSTAVACGASTTVTNGTDFDSAEISVPAETETVLLTLTFARAAGSSSTVDFYFQVSIDRGATWSSYTAVEVETQETAVTGTTVRASSLINTYGFTHIRLWKIVNNDGANALTACNATLSF